MSADPQLEASTHKLERLDVRPNHLPLAKPLDRPTPFTNTRVEA